MPVPAPPTSRPLLRRLVNQPWSATARRSPATRKWLDEHGYITPHFSWASYACTDGTPVPRELRANAIKLHWKLEAMRHAMGDIAMTVDGPYRTIAKNREVGGASDSRHTHADGADFFRTQVARWVRDSPTMRTLTDVIALANRVFTDGGVGNENSGTLHVDARGYRARFVTWVASR